MVLKIGRIGQQSRNTGKVWNVVLEKEGKDQLGRPCEKLGRVT